MADTYSPPEGVRAAARRALKWIEDGKAGANFTDVGRKRASDLARGASVSADTIKRMNSFFSRHEVDKKAEGFNSGEKGFPSPGRVAWDAWGGDPGQSWSRGIAKQLASKTERAQMSKNEWKITIPVALAEDRTDGLYIVGEASGPERDTHGTAMDPTAIQDFARQIKERAADGNPIPYIDHHQKDGVLRELGNVMDGSVTPDYHLQIAVRLDDANPAAMYLYNQIKRGKQYGMSIAGDGVDFRIEKDQNTGEKLIRFMRIVLREISNTTRPSWVPSFGTVLARSLDGELGEDMSEELVTDATTEVENAVESTEASEAVELSEETPTEETPVEAPAPEPTEQPVENAERARVTKKERIDSLLAAYAAIGEQLQALGMTADTNTVEDATEVVENTAETGDDTIEFNGVRIQRDLAAAISSEIERVTAPLRETVEAQAAYIKQLEELPAGKVPAPVVREKFEKAEPDLSNLSNEEKLRLGLAAIYGG